MRCCPVPAGRVIPSAWLLSVLVVFSGARALHAKVPPRGAYASPPAHVLTPHLLVPTSNSFPSSWPSSTIHESTWTRPGSLTQSDWLELRCTVQGRRECSWRVAAAHVHLGPLYQASPPVGQTCFPLLPLVVKVPHTVGGTDKLQCESRGCYMGLDSGPSLRPRPRSAVASA